MGGWALVIAGVLGAASGVVLAVVPPAVGFERFSYPLDSTGHIALQLFFFVHHLAIVLGLFAVWRSGYAGDGRLARIGAVGAIVSMGLLAFLELYVVTMAEAPLVSAQTDVVTTLYGVLSLANGVALILFGVAAIRAGRWTGWRRVLILVLGIYVFVPLLPALFGPFVLARLALAVWMLLFAALGVAVLRSAPVAAARDRTMVRS